MYRREWVRGGVGVGVAGGGWVGAPNAEERSHHSHHGLQLAMQLRYQTVSGWQQRSEPPDAGVCFRLLL